MLLQPGSLLALAVVPFAVVNSLYHLASPLRRAPSWRLHLLNGATVVAALVLAFLGAGTRLGEQLTFARLWLPILYYYCAYPLAGPTLHLIHPEGTSLDRRLIDLETRWLGNPSLWLARERPRWLNEAMSVLYVSYFGYVVVPGLWLYAAGDYPRFEAMALAACLAYAVCYSLYPWLPLWGPRWALVSEGLLPGAEQVLEGYAVSRWLNGLMWGGKAHKGGAMPSAHSAIGVVLLCWAPRIWGVPGAVVCAIVVGGMFVSTVYGRYHYVIDVVVGSTIGLLAVWLADLLVL